MNDKIIANGLSQIILEGKSIIRTMTPGNDIEGVISKSFNSIYKVEFSPYRSITKFQTSAENILRLRFGENSEYYKKFIKTYERKYSESTTTTTSYYKTQVEIQIGILEAVSYALENSLTDDLFY
ncbi:hypothetical protein [uncultured Methanomethylovorans sp.]|uniref:hypothetical protein n=1 Tax=uncultured Methanomethylovorans sp. TaxID=183759 RepID=UPI002AA7192E|nr:hypothetical protein [uncultured Methanomethylovorans sp.]